LAKSLSTNVTTGKAGDYEPVYLVELNLDGSYLRWGTKDTNDFGVSWSGNRFYGGRLHQLGVIDMEVDIEKGGNIYSTYDFEFTLLNHDSYHSTLAASNLYNREIIVRLIFADVASPTWANAANCFTGIIYDWDYDDEYITIQCTSKDKKYNKEIPETIITLDDFPNAPEASIGKRIPLVWGEFAGPDTTYQDGGDVVKALLVDKWMSIYIAMDHLAEANGDVFYWDTSLEELCPFDDESNDSGSSYTQLLNSKHYNIVDDPKVTKISRVQQNSRHTNNDYGDDAHEMHDLDISTYLDMTNASNEDEAIILLKDFYVDDEASIYMHCEIDFQGSSPQGGVLEIRLYENDFVNGIKSWNKVADELISAGNDCTTEWIASTRQGMNIDVYFNTTNATDEVYVKEIHIRAENVLVEQLPNVLYSISSGRAAGSWIASRSNGYITGDLLHNVAYVIESLLRDVLGLVSADIDEDSFDDVGNTTDGERDDWEFDGQLCDVIDSRKVLKKMCFESACICFERTNGEIALKAIDTSESSGGTIAGTSIMVDPETYKSTLRRKLTPLENIYNEFEVQYKYNPANNTHEERVFCNASDSTTGIGSTYETICSDSQSDYNVTRKLVIKADWIRDESTAIELCKFLVVWLANRREIISFLTSIKHIDLEIGDVRTVNNTFVNDVYMLVGIKHNCDADELELTWIEL